MGDTIFFNHKVGDGVHYVNDNFKTFKNGTFQLGDTSDVCILLNLEVVLSKNNVPNTVNDLWNLAYPDDFMSEEDIAYIVFSATEYADDFDPSSPDNITSALDDVRAMGCPELADLAKTELQAIGIPI
jgi:hypothetical protein